MVVKVRDYCEDEATLRELARANDTAIGRAFLRALDKKERETLDEIRVLARKGQGDMDRALRYKFGLADGAAWVKELIREAEAEMLKPERMQP
ncbi:MAG: hypothetical protein ABIH03_11250 [Pseudomonadota bacterium]